jgi:hypothetical protein
MQVAERRLVECEPLTLNERKQVLRTVREVEDLLLIRDLPATHSHAIKQRLDLGKRKGITFEHARIPDEFGQHPMKAEGNAFDRMDRQISWNRGAVPVKAEVSEKRHRRIIGKTLGLARKQAALPALRRIYDLSPNKTIPPAR